MTAVARTADDLTPEWFTEVLARPIESVTTTPIGTGQMSVVLCAEVTDRTGKTDSFVAKLASTDDTVRQTGLAMGFYAAETRFYREIAPTVEITVPPTYFADIEQDSGWFTLLMAHSPSATVGDMLAAGTVERAAAALRELVGLQAPRWEEPALRKTDWLQPTSWIAFAETFPDSLAPFLVRFGDQLAAEEIALCEKVMPHAVGWLEAWGGPTVLQHGDFRPDNILFETEADGAETLTVFDWQAIRVGPPLVDVGFYIGGSLSIEDRRDHETELIRGYHEALRAAGVTDYGWESCWEDYRRTALYGVYGFVGTSPHVQPSERGDALYLAAFRRFAAQAIDLDADEFLP